MLTHPSLYIPQPLHHHYSHCLLHRIHVATLSIGPTPGMGLRTLKVGTKEPCWGKADKLVKEPRDLLSNSTTVFWKLRVCSVPFLGPGHRLNKVALTPEILHSKWYGKPFGCYVRGPICKGLPALAGAGAQAGHKGALDPSVGALCGQPLHTPDPVPLTGHLLLPLHF